MSSDSPRSSLLHPQVSSELIFSSISNQGEPLKTSRWIELCSEDEVLNKGIYSYATDRDEAEYPILIVRTDSGLHALHDECPHRRVAISERGYLDGEVVHCGFHHWGFEIETGAHTMSTGICIDRFEVKVEGGRVLIGVPW